MRWKKIKHLFEPKNNYPWMLSHAANPTAEQISETVFRVYFSSRNSENQSYIGYVDIDFENNFDIINIAEEPIVTPGTLGLFDDSGTTVTCIANVNNNKYLYYLGWNLKVTVPWINALGLSIWNNQIKKFEKYSNAPILDRSIEDPYSVSYNTILFDNGKYRMWYGSCLEWRKIDGKLDYSYAIKYAESTDAVNWYKTNQIHINTKNNESALARPMVMKHNNKYYMWYSYKGAFTEKNYKIGYAESNDGNNWTRKDEEVGIDVSEEGWDSEMICYAYVVNYNGDLYMLYNGNGYGKTGFGIAKLIEL